MFSFNTDVPANIQAYLIPLLQAWIDRADLPLFRLETTRYGLVSFIRSPWPPIGVTTVRPAGEQDKAALDNFSSTF